MRIEVPHNTTRDKARKIVEQKMKALESQYGHYANDIDHQWQGDTLHFGFKAKGDSAAKARWRSPTPT